MRPPAPPSTERSLARQTGRASDLERRGPGPWHYVGAAGEPAFQNGWDNVGGDEAPMAFRQTLGAGIEIVGAVTGGTEGTAIFTLPAGYRPPKNRRLPASDELGGWTVLRVLATGDVIRGF